jgi:tRNA threonylcarbamoyladenosine biosynthesis protein TsaB
VRILAFDTATAATTVAVVDPERGIEQELRDDPPRGARPRHTARLLSLVAEALDGAGWRWEDVERIAVGTGPGTFTGLRIGVATARALGQARAIPVVGVSTLEALAVAALATGRERVLTVLDARRREVFAAHWRAGTGVRPKRLIDPLAVAPVGLAERVADIASAGPVVGDGAVAYREVLEASGAEVPSDDSPLHLVRAIHHGQVAQQLAAGHPDHVHPEYLRVPDAELTLRNADPS